MFVYDNIHIVFYYCYCYYFLCIFFNLGNVGIFWGKMEESTRLKQLFCDLLFLLTSSVVFSTSLISCSLVFCGRKRVLFYPSLFLPHYAVSHSKGSYLHGHRNENIQSRQSIRFSEFHLLVLWRTDALQMSCFMGQDANFLQFKRSTVISKNVTYLWYDCISSHRWHRMKYTVTGTASCIFLPTDMCYISLCLYLPSYLTLRVYRHAYWDICILTTYRHSYWHL